MQEEPEKSGCFAQNTEVILMLEYFQLLINCKVWQWEWVPEWHDIGHGRCGR